ncbi:hypothetical protein HY640_01420 [Candidatus Woesearchaeota archaeon]|nr:hypothetical protein [Candidatus Woesearchaeota archaeon]
MGRKPGSQIRQNIIELLSSTGEGYGYQIYLAYRQIFPKATMRSIYYQLRKGVQTGEIKIKAIRKIQGNYSWGTEAEKKIYALGEHAKAKGNSKVDDYLKKRAS